MRSRSILAVLAAAVTFAGCSDRSPTAAGPAPAPPLEKYDCVASVRELRMSCDGAVAVGVRASIYGGQNVNVRLTSTHVSYDSATRIFSADVAVRNLSRQAMGSADGVNADSAGIRTFFSAGPYVTAGRGAVWVSNADGYDAFTHGDQPYFRYPGILAPDSVTAARSWKWHLDPTVDQFSFTILLDARVTPALVISEIMAHPGTSPEADGEWFEVYNAGFLPVDLSGWTIASGGDAVHTIGGSLVVAPGGYLVLGRSTDAAANGEAGVAYAYGAIDLANDTDDWLALRSPAGLTADSVSWGAADGETASAPPVGISLALDSPTADNLHLGGAGSAWIPSPGFFGTGQYGSPGMGTLRPLAATSIVVGSGHSCALDGQGQAWCWGWNSSGQLGNGKRTGPDLIETPTTPPPDPGPEKNRAEPMIQPGLHFTSLAATAGVTCAAERLGGIYCTGFMYATAPNRTTLGLLLDVSVASLWSGNQICGVTPDGQPYCRGTFGYWYDGFFGPAPKAVPGIIAVANGQWHACELDAAGSLYCFGGNGFGEVGDGTFELRMSFVPVHQPVGVAFTAVTSGSDHTCALATTGQAYCWGRNDQGQLGDGSGANQPVPVPVQQPPGVRFTAISAASFGASTCALASDGRAYCWGANTYGQLGDGTTTARSTPTLVQAPAGVTFSAIDVGFFHSCALTNPRGQPACWGDNQFGELGDGTYTNRTRPVSAGR